jgi:hypothetical protein
MADSGAADTSADSHNELERYQQILLVSVGLFGCLVMWGGVTQLVDDLRLRFFGLETMGVVVERQAESSTIPATPSRGSRSAAGSFAAQSTVSRGPSSTTVFRPIVAIDTPDGKARIRGTLLEGLEQIAPIGARVPVLYLAGRPADGQIKSEVKLSWVHLLTAIIGFGLVAAPLAVLVLTGTWRRPDRLFAALRRRAP